MRPQARDERLADSSDEEFARRFRFIFSVVFTATYRTRASGEQAKQFEEKRGSFLHF
jgi:hypothetical protein